MWRFFKGAKWTDEWMIGWFERYKQKGGKKEERKGRKEERMSIHQYSKWARSH